MPEPQVTVTARWLMDHDFYVRAGEFVDLDGVEDADTVTLTLGQAAEIGLLDTAGPVEPAREQPHRIDPPGCGCTDCMTLWSVPLDEASDSDVFAMRAGQIRDATGEEFETVVTEGWSGARTVVRARWSGREWTRAER